MSEYIAFWFAKIIAQFTVTLILALLVLGILMALILHEWLKQWRCKHENFWENRSCDAICHGCRKNLGFILTVRRNRDAKRDSKESEI